MSETNEGRISVETAQYIRDNFQPEDRLAVVLINKHADAVLQRLASADKIATPDFLAWLHEQNARRYEVYLSMNALQPYAQSRTKGAVGTIRHVFLDLDEDATNAVDKLLRRGDLPKPNFLINSSPGKWQVLWKVSGFDKQEAEQLQKGLARECGADPAATDCARVLRVPGFYNHKYADSFMVRAEALANEMYGPDWFPKFAVPTHSDHDSIDGAQQQLTGVRRKSSGITQSERDWAFAKRALARGDPPDLIAAAIACYRRFDKYSPKDYALRTVAKAAAAIKAEQQVMGLESRR